VKILKGSSRTVLLTKKYAIKLPFTFYKGFGYRKFWYRLLRGLLANIQELEYKNCPDIFFEKYNILLNVPLFGFKSGLCNVYKKSEPIKGNTNFKKLPDIVENKNDSFGIINGILYCIDYA
jgi:hypothetical protein